MTQYTLTQARELADKPLHMSVEPIRDALRSLADQLEQANLQHIAEDGERQDAPASSLLTEQDAGLLEQAASMLEGLEHDERSRGNDSAAAGAGCSAHAVRRMALVAMRAEALAAPDFPLMQEQFSAWFDALPWYVRSMWPRAAAPVVPAPGAPDCWVVVRDGRIIGTNDEPCKFDGIDGVRYVPAAQAAPVAQLSEPPEGWKLVPTEPTDEMLNAPENAWPADASITYRAMLAAAPTIPKD